jgi:hypothetical protein
MSRRMPDLFRSMRHLAFDQDDACPNTFASRSAEVRMRFASHVLVIAAAGALAVAGATPLAGQGDSFTPGARVRVQVSREYARAGGAEWPDRRRIGVAHALGDTLTLFVGTDSVAIPRAAIERLWISTRASRRGRSALQGAGVGLLAGGVVGALAAQDCTEGGFGASACASRAELAAVGAAGGAGIGALVGAAMGGERWSEVKATGGHILIARSPGGLALMVALRF